jgi:hypothetical protein
LREEYKLRVFENRVLRKMFGPSGDKATGEWRRLHKEELYALYSSIHIIRVIISRRMESVKHVTRKEERRGAYKVVVERPEGRRPLRRPKSR